MIRAAYQVTEALATQYLPADLLAQLQLRRLKQLLAYCWQKVPLYRRLWTEARVTPEQVRCLADLPRLPIPNRRTIEEAPEELISRDFLELYRTHGGVIRHSGGSSGGPQLEVYADAASWSRLDAYYYRAMAALGYRPWLPMAYYWGAPFQARAHNALGFMPKIGVPAQLDEAGQLAVLEQNPGVWWYYHPTSLFPLARRYPERLRVLAPGRIISHAELLSDSMRAGIEAVMGQRVFNQYGTSEFNRMAWSCPGGPGYHVDAESIVLEVLKDDGRPAKPGEVGRAVVTGLVNRMMPLIRYELGDLLVASDRRCVCGRSLPMLESLEGRWRDRFVLPDGGTRTPRELMEPAGAVEGVELFRVTVESPAKLLVEYVATATEAARARLEAELKRRYRLLCPRVEVRVARVADIEKAPGGKRVLVRNKVPAAPLEVPA
jgi:phenylacetate-CoA ligase